MTNKFKAIILIIALALGGIFISNMPSNDKSLKRKNNELKTQITELSNLNTSLKEQNKIYESTIGDLTTENNTKDATISDLQEQNQAKDTTIAELQEQLENSSGSESSAPFDLTNTIWQLHEEIILRDFYFNINFSTGDLSDTPEYSSFYHSKFSPNGDDVFNYLCYDSDNIAYSSTYTLSGLSNSDRLIHIIDGEDVTNIDFISWLFNNAEYINIDNLMNTYWHFNDYLDLSEITNNYTNTNTIYLNLQIDFSYDYASSIFIPASNPVGSFKNLKVYYNTSIQGNVVVYQVVDYVEGWVTDNYRCFKVIGGDTTNIDYIKFLLLNATFHS